MYPVLLEVPRVRLREFEDRDLEGVLRVYGDPVATRQLSFEPRTRDQVARFLANSARQAREEPRMEYALAVALVEGGEAIGSARLAVGEHRSGQFGLAIDAERWGMGLGIEAARLLLDLGFHGLGLHRLWGARAPDNIVSKRLMGKLGMVEECRIRDHVFVRGAWRDSIVHAILEHEWSGTQAPR